MSYKIKYQPKHKTRFAANGNAKLQVHIVDWQPIGSAMYWRSINWLCNKPVVCHHNAVAATVDLNSEIERVSLKLIEEFILLVVFRYCGV